MSKFKKGSIPSNIMWHTLEGAISYMDSVIDENLKKYGVLLSDSLLHVIEPQLYRSFSNNTKKWGVSYRPAKHIKNKYTGVQTTGFFPHPKLIKLMDEFKKLTQSTNPDLTFREIQYVNKSLKSFIRLNFISAALYKDMVKMIGGTIINESSLRKQRLLKDRKNEFSKWILKNHHKIERLSYSTIKRYLDENGLTELSKSWHYLWKELRQNGLIEYFKDNGLEFWVQDNKKSLDNILKQLLYCANKFYKDNGYTPYWSGLVEYGFSEKEYLIRNGWGLRWTKDNLNDFYVKNGLPLIPVKSEKSIDEVMSMDLDKTLDDIFESFGCIPKLRTLIESDMYYDFRRYLIKIKNDTKVSPNKTYEGLWLKKFGKDYVKFTKQLYSLDGHRCDSKHELILMNYRFLNGLPNNPHVTYKEIFPNTKTNFICDNYVEGRFVTEIAGYSPNIKKHKKYWEKIKEKEEICKSNGIDFILIEGYRYIGTKSQEFLDYIHEIYTNLYDDIVKPNYFDVIKSQKTEIYVEEIVRFFQYSKVLSWKEINKGLSDGARIFFKNNIKGINNFIKLYNEGVFDMFDSTKGIKIDFNNKSIRKYNG